MYTGKPPCHVSMSRKPLRKYKVRLRGVLACADHSLLGSKAASFASQSQSRSRRRRRHSADAPPLGRQSAERTSRDAGLFSHETYVISLRKVGYLYGREDIRDKAFLHLQICRQVVFISVLQHPRQQLPAKALALECGPHAHQHNVQERAVCLQQEQRNDVVMQV